MEQARTADWPGKAFIIDSWQIIDYKVRGSSSGSPYEFKWLLRQKRCR